MKVEYTNRGFEVIEFIDADTNKCSIQQSSVFTEENFDKPGASFLRMGRDQDRMHLSKEMVIEIIEHLKKWVETGSLE